jgi:hypothetical protein
MRTKCINNTIVKLQEMFAGSTGLVGTSRLDLPAVTEFIFRIVLDYNQYPISISKYSKEPKKVDKNELIFI